MGGFRRDLTHIFENDTAFNREFGSRGDANFLLGVEQAGWPGGAGLFPNSAPNWGILRSFYGYSMRLTDKSVMPLTPSFFGTTNNLNAYDLEDYHDNSPLHPVLSWFQMGIGVRYLEQSVEGGFLYIPQLLVRPVISIYNPYDVAIPSRDYILRIRYNPKVIIQIEGRDPVEFAIHELMESWEERNVGTYFRLHLDDVDFRPGETRYFALDSTYHFDSNPTNMFPDWQQAGILSINFTEHPQVEVATQEGPVFSQSAYGPAFGLTESERDRLEVFVPEGDPLPSVDISVTYDSQAMIRAFAFRTSGVSPNLSVMDRGVALNTDSAPQVVNRTFSPLTAATPDISTLGLGLRTTDSSFYSHRQFIDANLRAFRISRDIDRLGPDSIPLPSGWEGQGFAGNSFEEIEPEIANFDRYSGFFGSSRRTFSITNQDFDSPAQGLVTLFHVPRTRPISLGVLQHANLGRYSHHPSYIIGNSYARGRIPLGETALLSEQFYDWSYAVNLHLWDSYFFSGVPQDLSDNQLQDLRLSNELLPNPRLLPARFDVLPLESGSWTDGASESTPLSVAARLQVNGAFNVNSTSVPAWKAFLGSMSGLAMPLVDPADGTITSTVDEDLPFFSRTPVVLEAGHEASDSSGALFWNSHRRLSETELNELAIAMVEEVKARGPFSSIADFVNRRLTGADSLRRSGALQSALDRTVNLNLNSALTGLGNGEDLVIPDSGFNANNINPSDRPGTGGRGWVTQADVLQSIGSIITVRADTFKIRAYGESVDPSGMNTTAKAWCELIVQRIAEPVHLNNNLSEEELLEADETFGRQFKIISFRWLNADEV